LSKPVLWHIAVSHYNEKVRWALELKGVEHERRAPPPPANMLVAMALAAALCVGIGIFPAPLYALLPYPVDYEPYSGGHVLAQLQLLIFSALAFAVLMRTGIYPPELPSVNLDFDWTYRRLLPRALRFAAAVLSGTIAAAESRAGRGWDRAEAQAKHFHGPRGVLARTWPSGAMAFGVMLMLLALLLSYYLF
jgi:multicomponent Na+:H+ antiporter subunit D